MPGGPGFTAECFEKFARNYLSDYRVLAVTPTGLQKADMQLWAEDLEKALVLFPTDILVGHSFGGLLAL